MPVAHKDAIRWLWLLLWWQLRTSRKQPLVRRIIVEGDIDRHLILDVLPSFEPCRHWYQHFIRGRLGVGLCVLGTD